MNSSGIKRGLAGSAITALAIAGLPFLATSASAAPLGGSLAAGETDILSLYTGTASVRDDGKNQTVHLLAAGGADVQQVRFEYDYLGKTETIATVSRVNNAFSTEWTPPAATYGSAVVVRAVGLNSVGTPVATNDETPAVVSANATSVDIGNAAGSTLPVFPQPYGVEAQEAGTSFDGVDHSTAQGIVTGTTSGSKVDLVDLSAGAAASRPATVAEPVNGISTFKGTVDMSGYTLDTKADAVNQAAIGADTDQSDDAEVVNLKKQTISGVTAVAQPANVPSGSSSTGVITVTDQDGNPLAGAQVIYDADNDGVWDGSEASKYTDANGQAKFTGLTGTAAGKTYAFFVNTDGGDDYESAKDFKRTITVTSFAQVPTALKATSNDGAAFDSDEYTDGDVSVKVTDQNGDALKGQTVSYTIKFTPAPTTATPNPATETTSGTTAASDDKGNATIPVPTSYLNRDGSYVVSTYINQDGTPGQGDGDLSAADLKFVAGESTLKFDSADAAAAGSTATYSATLALFDGTPLVGRDVQFSYAPNGDDVVVAAQANQPAGTTRDSNTQATDTTDASGKVQVALSDPANTPARSELKGMLDADTLTTKNIGNAGEDAEDISVKFVTDKGPEGTAVTLDEDKSTGKPGVAISGSGQALTDDPKTTTVVEEKPAPGVLVTLTVDGDAFFTDGTYEKHAANEKAGDLTTLGKSITVITDSNGEFTYKLGVEKSTDFDDDGKAKFNVTAAISGSTDTEDYDFSSSNPLNGGEVKVKFASAKFQESGVLPKAPTTDRVAYDVSVTDQFGNAVGDATVSITSDNGTIVDNDGDVPDDNKVTTDFSDNVEFFLTSDAAVNATPTGTWNAPANLFTAASPSDAYTDRSGTTADLKGNGPTAEFYEVDFADSTYTLSQNGAETQPVGSTVIMTYTAKDQNGEPIDFFVDFFRTGPDNQQGGEANSKDVRTGQDGQATYVFAGTAEGTATVTAIASETEKGEAIAESQVTDTVTFGPGESEGPNDPDAPIVINISGDDNGGAKDVVRALVTNGEAETIKLFKIRGKVKDGNRRLKQVREDVVPEGGNLTFKVADRNGNKKTRFIAKVSRDAQDGPENFKSNTQKIR